MTVAFTCSAVGPCRVWRCPTCAADLEAVRAERATEARAEGQQRHLVRGLTRHDYATAARLARMIGPPTRPTDALVCELRGLQPSPRVAPWSEGVTRDPDWLPRESVSTSLALIRMLLREGDEEAASFVFHHGAAEGREYHPPRASTNPLKYLETQGSF